MQKVFIVLLASLIGMLLCSGVASAAGGNCCEPINGEDIDCFCREKANAAACVEIGGIWVGDNNCVEGTTTGCTKYCTQGGQCVPEMSTIALLATGLIGMVGYLGLRRKEE